jgi:hypothetical protein
LHRRVDLAFLYRQDEMRGVLFIASEPVPITAIEWLEWREEPMPADRDALLGAR